VRLSSYAYTLDKMNYYIHLTNNAVQSSCAEYGALMKGNIFSVSELEDYARAAGKRPELPTFMAQIRETIRRAFDATHDILNPNLREHSFELFGFDFMVDEKFKVWMLECNSGPSLSESNAFLSQLLHRMIGRGASPRRPLPGDRRPAVPSAGALPRLLRAGLALPAHAVPERPEPLGQTRPLQAACACRVDEEG
jgi:hypothetical protein